MADEIRRWTESFVPSRGLMLQSQQTRNERALPGSICGGSHTSSEHCHSVGEGKEEKGKRKTLMGKNQILERVLHKYMEAMSKNVI